MTSRRKPSPVLTEIMSKITDEDREKTRKEMMKIEGKQVYQDNKFIEGAQWMLNRVEEFLSDLTITIEQEGIEYNGKIEPTQLHNILNKLKIW